MSQLMLHLICWHTYLFLLYTDMTFDIVSTTDMLLDMADHLLSYNPSNHKFFVLEPNFWVSIM